MALQQSRTIARPASPRRQHARRRLRACALALALVPCLLGTSTTPALASTPAGLAFRAPTGPLPAALAMAPTLPTISREEAVASELLLHTRRLGRAQARRTASALCAEARRQALDPLLFLAVIAVESSYNPQARSLVGAQGLMQLMPATAQALARKAHEPWAEDASFDPVVNVRLGVRYIGQLWQQFHQLDLALTAYNRGPYATRQLLAAHGSLPPGVSALYAARVLSQWRLLQGTYGGSAVGPAAWGG